MTPAERRAAFDAAVKLAAGARNRIQEDTAAEITRLLRGALDELQAKLGGKPSEFELWQIPRLQREVERMLAAFGEEAGQAAIIGQAQAWDAGQRLIDTPLQAAGFSIDALAPQISKVQLLSMQAFLTGKMQDVALDAVNRVNSELALTLIGSQGIEDAIKNIQQAMGGIARRRATTIIRTELGRAYAVASQTRAVEAQKQVPGLKKQWRRSGKIHSRRKHDLTDGQIRPVDKPFILGTGAASEDQEGGGIRLMHPHDPAAPASETINCGCISLPYLDEWADSGALENPGKRPFTPEEIALNPTKAELAEPGPTIGELQAKRDAAATLEAPKVRRVLREVERRIGSEKVEVAVVMDQSGNILDEIRGDAAQVSIPSAKLKDAIVTHTHVDIASFSDSDIRVAMTHQMAEIRAVDPWYTYIMRPGPKGWDQLLWTDTVAPLYEQMEAETVGRFLDLMAADKATQDEFLEHAQHAIWGRISRAVGLRYTRRKRP